jgi:hypothetical protein
VRSRGRLSAISPRVGSIQAFEAARRALQKRLGWAQIAVVLSKSRAAVKELLRNKLRKIKNLAVSFLLPMGIGFVYRFCLS